MNIYAVVNIESMSSTWLQNQLQMLVQCEARNNSDSTLSRAITDTHLLPNMPFDLWHGILTPPLTRFENWHSVASTWLTNNRLFCEILQGCLSECNILGWKESYERPRTRPGVGRVQPFIPEIYQRNVFIAFFAFEVLSLK